MCLIFYIIDVDVRVIFDYVINRRVLKSLIILILLIKCLFVSCFFCNLFFLMCFLVFGMVVKVVLSMNIL